MPKIRFTRETLKKAEGDGDQKNGEEWSEIAEGLLKQGPLLRQKLAFEGAG